MRQKKILSICFLILIMTLAACSNSASKDANNDNNSDSSTDNKPSSVSDLDPDDNMTPFIEKGEELLGGSEEASSGEEAEELTCMSCHAGSTEDNGVSLVGITNEYPEFDERKGESLTLEEKVNESFERTLNKEKLPYDEEEMRSIIAYLTFISEGTDSLVSEDEVVIDDIPEPDLDNGEKLFDEELKETSPPLWGDDSFTDGSNLTRMSVMTNYIKNYLPEDDPGSFLDQEAADVAAYILSQDRPEWKDDESDWPDSDKPADYINQEEREAIQDGTFDWSVVNEDNE